MKWNNGLERKRFEKRMKKQEKNYRELGMSEEGIQDIYLFDLEVFRSDRRFAEHNQPLVYTDDSMEEHEICPLLKSFLETRAVEMESSKSDIFWWIDEIENLVLLEAIKKLSPLQKLILTMIAFEDMNSRETAEAVGKSASLICKELKAIRKALSEKGFGREEDAHEDQ